MNYRIIKTNEQYIVQRQNTDKYWQHIGFIRPFREKGANYFHAVVELVGSYNGAKENNLFEATTFVLWKNGFSVRAAEELTPILIEKISSSGH